VNNSTQIKIFNINDVDNDNLDRSYDHLIKQNLRKEELKQKELDENEELKEGFIGDLYNSALKEEKRNKPTLFNTNEMSIERSRAKTSLFGGIMETTHGDIIRPREPMINNICGDRGSGMLLS